ncbi:hypothetical protein SynBOUM118_01049 [Synechococcus sp. BOUM118]|nr:hypothetical protein SynBOUM118_01049 [Synechococcus sp. BOUM118]
MTEIELNRLRAKLRRLAFTEEAIDRTLRRFQRDLETFASASRIIEGLKRDNPEQQVLQALACGLIAAVLGGWFATVY